MLLTYDNTSGWKEQWLKQFFKQLFLKRSTYYYVIIFYISTWRQWTFF